MIHWSESATAKALRVHEMTAKSNDWKPPSEAMKACIDHARDLLNSADAVFTSGSPHIAYHLAALALEELGRRELLGMQSVDAQRPVPSTWHSKHSQDHVKKLFWAFFGGSFFSKSLTKEGIEEMQSLAAFIHETRMSGLYVDVSDDGLNIPRDAIPSDMAKNLIELARARLGMVEGDSVASEVSPEDRAPQQWLLSAAVDDAMRPTIFSSASLQKLSELKDPRAWVSWLQAQFAEAESKAIDLAKKEIERSRDVPEARARTSGVFEFVCIRRLIRCVPKSFHHGTLLARGYVCCQRHLSTINSSSSSSLETTCQLAVFGFRAGTWRASS